MWKAPPKPVARSPAWPRARFRCLRRSATAPRPGQAGRPQDGDDEGCLHLDHVPTPAEADLIGDALKIKRKRHYTPDQLASITDRLSKNATRDPSRPTHIRQKKKKAHGSPNRLA